MSSAPKSWSVCEVFAWLFLPEGYPHSVAPDYFNYQLWDTIQQVVYFVMSILGYQAMYAFFGVGNPHAGMAGAILLQFSRDLLHQYVLLGVSFPAAVALYQSRPGLFRMLGEVLNVAGIVSEILACEFRSMWLMWMGPLLWCLSGSMCGVVRKSILQHFAKTQNNRDVVLKENNQDKGGKMGGLLGGVLLLQFLGMSTGDAANEESKTVPSLITVIILASLHLYSNYRAVRALQCPPARFSLRNSASQCYASVVRCDRVIEAASDERSDVFKLAVAGGVGIVLMTLDGEYVDKDGQLQAHPVSAELHFSGNGWIMEANWGSKAEGSESGEKALWEIMPRRNAGKLEASSCNLQSSFFPPGFPRTTPPKYEAHCAYSIMLAVTNMPLRFIDMWMTWSFVYGVGDNSKSPEYAVYIDCYISVIVVFAALLSGLPNFSRGYNANFFFISHLLGNFCAGFIGFAAALSPFRVFLILVAIQKFLAAWSSVVHSAVTAQADMVWAGHPEVDLAHISASHGNRISFLSALTGALCFWYAYHLHQAGEVAEPPIATMAAMYTMMQVANLYSAYKMYEIYQSLLMVDTQESDSQHGNAVTESRPLESEVPSEATAGAGTRRANKKPALVTIAQVLPSVLARVIVYAALVSTLSDVNSKLVPCSERCMQFKLAADDSFIPNTGIWPFQLHNGESRDEIIHSCTSFGGNNCHAMPGARCKGITRDTCTNLSTLESVHNPLKHAKSKYAFLVSLIVYSILVLVHDSALRMDCLDSANAIILQVFSTYALAFMTGAALLWSSGVLQLFFSNVGGEDCVGNTTCDDVVCGCYFEVGEIASMLAMAVPVALIISLRAQTICTMRAAIVGSSFLSTVKYHIPHNFLPPDSVNEWSALGPGRFGHPHVRERVPIIENSLRMRQAKSMARWICLLCPLLILPAMLLASCSLIYRGVALMLVLVRDHLPIDIGGDVASSMAMYGFYGMIFLQFGILYLFIPETWRLFYILSIQLGKCDGNLDQVIADSKIAHPELAWTIIASARQYSRLPDALG